MNRPLNRPETQIIEQRIISRYEMILGAVSVLLLVGCLITIFSGAATLLTWVGLVLFGIGTYFFVRELRAPKQELVLSADGLVERVGDRELLNLTWAQVVAIEDNGKTESVTIRVADSSGDLVPLPAVPEPSGDDDQDFGDFEAYNEELLFARPKLAWYGNDQRKTAATIVLYKESVDGSR